MRRTEKLQDIGLALAIGVGLAASLVSWWSGV
jgi:hypothetical protein